jgi:hypothetical protein
VGGLAGHRRKPRPATLTRGEARDATLPFSQHYHTGLADLPAALGWRSSGCPPAPDLNPAEDLWSSLKAVELSNPKSTT